ncbi:MAG: class I SAM-dependent methyltransferase [Proteobacteria bacterium]|nr:class I SAM-dependent methyltransferase [Pseudomonadota bacterium]
MNNLELKEKYDRVFKEGSENFFTCNIFHESWSIVGQYDWEGLKVLDIGCGEGILPAMIAHAGAKEVIGVDYSEEAIDNANSKFNISNLKFIAGDYRNIEDEFDVITMQGVLEHFDEPWEELKNIVDNYLTDDGLIITSSPSFLNPRGYVWMTLQKLFDIPMSLTDLHYICPFDMEEFCEEWDCGLEYESIHQDWGGGETMIRDFNKRLRNALRDANMDNSKVDDLLEWLDKAKEYFQPNNDTGAIVVYKIYK